jgi:AraC-like DNA-binding protein
VELPALRARLKQMRSWLRQGTPLARWRCALAAAGLFERLLEGRAAAVPDAPEQRLKERLDAPRGLTADLADLARDCGCTLDHLARRYERRYGLSPARYREQRRMAVALELLADGGLPLRQIARRVGYRQHAAFTAAFRRCCGKPPSAVRGARAGKDLPPPR